MYIMCYFTAGNSNSFEVPVIVNVDDEQYKLGLTDTVGLVSIHYYLIDTVCLVSNTLAYWPFSLA